VHLRHILIALALSLSSPSMLYAQILNCQKQTSLYDLTECYLNIAIKKPNYFSPSYPYIAPNEENLADFYRISLKMLQGQCKQISLGTLKENYTLMPWQHKNQRFCILTETRIDKKKQKVRYGWGSLIINMQPKKELNFEIPHPYNDKNTWKQGISLFNALNAHAIFIAGTNRYAASKDKKNPCQKLSRYGGILRKGGNFTDSAHNNTLPINAFNLALKSYYQKQKIDKWHVIQLHGMDNSACGKDAIMISFGSNRTFVANYPNSMAYLLAKNFKQSNPKARVLIWAKPANPVAKKSCDVPGIICTTHCSMTGGSNVQARVINGVEPQFACLKKAQFCDIKGHFIHIEQAPKWRIPNDTKLGQAWLESFELAWQQSIPINPQRAWPKRCKIPSA
jgi:hypothetical protein